MAKKKDEKTAYEFFREELERTAVISDSFKSRLLSLFIWGQQQAADNARTLLKQAKKGGK